VATKDLSPDEIVALLLATANGGGPKDPQRPDREDLIRRVRNHFLAIARRHFAHLGDEIEDAVQLAIMEVCRVENLAGMRDRAHFWRWARGILLNKCNDARRAWFRRKGRFVEPNASADGDDDSGDWLERFTGSRDDDPGSLADHREILRRVAEVISRHEVGRLRLLLDLSEQEVCAKLGLTRHQVAQQLKRLRHKLRELLKVWQGGDT